MKPFSARMYRDSITLFRATSVTSGQGTPRPTYPSVGVDSPASVQSERVDRMDTGGRVFSISMHEVYTPENIAARTGDRIEWLGRKLAVEAATVPKGIDDVIWCTYCVETR